MTSTALFDGAAPQSGSSLSSDKTRVSESVTDEPSGLPVVAEEQGSIDGHWREIRIVEGVLVSIPYPDRQFGVSIRDEETPYSFFHLFSALERLAADQTVVGITSAVRGEGKTTVALHLALAVARSSYKRVCLVDLSLGEDELCRRVGAAPAPAGVNDYLDSDRAFAGLVWPGSVSLTLIPAGLSSEKAARIARSPRLPELVAALRASYDLVIVDLPAVITDNAVTLAQQMDGVVVVMRAGATPRAVIRAAVDTLGKDLVTGVVLNRTTSARRGLFKWNRAR